MGKKILFSPVGGTDPIKYCRDGSMLHISRVYQPDVVYLYLSQEMLEHHRGDDRYVKALEKLGELLHHKFEVHIIEREKLVNVQRYDVFYEDFRQLIRKIESRMEQDDELLLNMASGTPAMKNALLVLATLAEYRFKTIQVDTPLKRQNSDFEEHDIYDLEEFWKSNRDNEPGFENRTHLIECVNLLKLLKMDMIKKHILVYDYTAALSVAKEIRGDLSGTAYTLLEIADARSKLNRSKVMEWNREKKFEIFPVSGEEKQKLFEYALVLQIKVQKEEYADFVRGITPIVVDLLENILKNDSNVELKKLCKDKSNVPVWDENKLKRTPYIDILNRKFGTFRYGPVYSSHVAELIDKLSKNAEIKRDVAQIGYIEKKVRNIAAHEIVSVTDEWIKSKTKKTAVEIMELIKRLFADAGIVINEEAWKSYDQMNEKIVHELI